MFVMRRRDEGAIALVAALMLLPISMLLALVLDSGRVWVERHRLQDGVEVAALKAAHTWANGGAPCDASSLSVLNADGASPSSVQCSSTGTRTAGTLKVAATDRSPLAFGALLGRSSAGIAASTTARISGASRVSGLWPFALCVDNPAVSAWIASGFTSSTSTRITFEAPSNTCRGSVTGNWSVLDFNGGSVSNVETQDWVLNGYSGTVSVGDVVQGTPGAPSTSLQMSSMIGKSVFLPLYTNPRYNGSNAVYTMAGFAQVKVIGVQFSGAAAQRSLTIQFQRGFATGSVGGNGAPDFGLVSVSVCSIDQQGVCS